MEAGGATVPVATRRSGPSDWRNAAANAFAV
jgi:hypothetical protein